MKRTGILCPFRGPHKETPLITHATHPRSASPQTGGADGHDHRFHLHDSPQNPVPAWLERTARGNRRPGAQGAQRILFVTDQGVLKAGLADAALAGLKDAGLQVHVYDKVVADPPESTVFEAVAEGQEFGAEAVIGFGGGSPMDTAKVVALLLSGEQSLSTMYGVQQVRANRPPLILLPTTAGTGSEVTNVAVLTTGATSKRGIAADPLYADMAILDPDLTLGLPKHPTAYTGIDAMVHAIEAFTNRRSKTPCRTPWR